MKHNKVIPHGHSLTLGSTHDNAHNYIKISHMNATADVD